MGVWVAPAGALTTHLLLGSFTGEGTPAGFFGNPNGIAIDESTRDLYVADIAHQVVDKFDASGHVVNFAALGSSALDGRATPAGSFAFPSQENDMSPAAVAVDNDPLSPAFGDLYVLDAGHGVIDKFSSAGAYLGQLTGTTGGPFATTGPFGGPVGVAVDTGGNVWVYESNGKVDRFDSSGAFVSQFATGCEAWPSLAVDSSDDVYVNCVFSVHKFGSSGIELETFPNAGNLAAIAVDQADNHAFLIQGGSQTVEEYDSTGAPVTSFRAPAGAVGYTGGIAVDGGSGDVYISSKETRTVYRWGPLVTLADVATGAASGVQPASIALSGAVNPDGVQVSACQFEYGTSTSYGQTAPCAQEPGSGTSEVPVSAELSGLQPDTAYHYRLTASNAQGTNQGEDREFTTTGPPTVDEESAANVGQTSATLQAQVNPRGFDTTYHFEYGTSTAYGTSVPIPDGDLGASVADQGALAELAGLQAGTTYHYRVVAVNSQGTVNGSDSTFTTVAPARIGSVSASEVTAGSATLHAQIDPLGNDTTYRFEYGASTAYGSSIPAPDGDIGAGTGSMNVAQPITGLQANTTYHYRVAATNLLGTARSGDHTFIYDTTGAGLPDNRAYEMVTPPQKNGASLGLDSFVGTPPLVSETGSRLILGSLQCFAGAGSCTAIRNGDVGSPYAFSRTAGGWVATALSPPATTTSPFNTPLGTDANTGTALVAMPTRPGGPDDFYAGGLGGAWADIGPTTPHFGETGAPQGVLTTVDHSHVVWSTGYPIWPFDATNSKFPAVYEYSGVGNSQPALVGVSGGAGSTDLISVCGTELGGYLSYLTPMSIDGRTVFFTANACFAGSGVNAGTPVPAETLYARLDESRTVLISGRSPLECTGGCQSSPPSSASFVGASADGSKAFFTDTQRLTDGASEDSRSADARSPCSATTGANGCNLYEYDFANPAGRNLLAVSAGDASGGGPRVQGVIALSSDGSHVYFVAKGVLSGAANAQGQSAKDGAENLYVFTRDAGHPSGRVAFVASLPEADYNDWLYGPDYRANVTPDGRYLVFPSHGRLTPDATSPSGVQQLFRYDAQTGELVRISIGNNGFNDNGNAGTQDATIVPGVDGYLSNGSRRGDPTMSDDGSYVFFMSPNGLTPQALNDVPIGTDVAALTVYANNIYEWHEGHVFLISDGRDTASFAGTSAVRLAGSDAKGANVFFSTVDRLAPQDTDTELDFYDARICTSSEPCLTQQALPVACQGEACRAAPGVAPVFGAPGSATFAGAGNPAAQAKPVTKPGRKAKHRKKARHGRRVKHKRKVRGVAGNGKHIKRGRR
jgi:hypothetical protein